MYNTEELLSKLRAETATLHAQIARMKQREGELAKIAHKYLEQYYETAEGMDPEEKAEYDADSAVVSAALQSVAKEGEQ